MISVREIFSLSGLHSIQKKVVTASPVIAFFLFLFCTVIYLFGVKYI